MKRTFTLIIALILVLSFEPIAQTQNQALIFSIDVSKSMLQPPGFYTTLKENIKSFIKNDVQVNDLVTIYSFGDDVKIISDVVNFKVTGTQDIEKLIQFIDKLKPTDNKTFLTKAIDIFASQMESLQSQYKNLPIKAFLFTDGKNDPPTGGSSLTLNDILNKHKATFQNPFTYTYIITLGTQLDKDLQDAVNDPKSGISVTSETKDLRKKSVSIIPSNQKLKINSSNINDVKAKFQFLSIKNIGEGTIKFNRILGTSVEIGQNEIHFDSSFSGKYFYIPLKVSSENKSGNLELKLEVLPDNKTFEVIPKVVRIELEYEETSIELLNDSLVVETTTEGGMVQIRIKGDNKSSKDVKVIPLLDPIDQSLLYEGNYITLAKGEFENELELKVNPITVGDYPYTLSLQTVEGEVKIDKTIPIILKVTAPFNWGPILTIFIILLVIGLIVGLFYLYFFLVDREFSKYTISGMSLNKEPLNEFKKFWQTKIIIGKNIFSDTIGEEVFTVKADVLTPFNKELKLEWSQVNKDRILPNDILSYDTLKPIRVQFDKKYQFEIEKTNN